MSASRARRSMRSPASRTNDATAAGDQRTTGATRAWTSPPVSPRSARPTAFPARERRSAAATVASASSRTPERAEGSTKRRAPQCTTTSWTTVAESCARTRATACVRVSPPTCTPPACTPSAMTSEREWSYTASPPITATTRTATAPAIHSLGLTPRGYPLSAPTSPHVDRAHDPRHGGLAIRLARVELQAPAPGARAEREQPPRARARDRAARSLGHPEPHGLNRQPVRAQVVHVDRQRGAPEAEDR